METRPREFRRTARRALADARLQRALGAATDRFAGAQLRARAEIPRWEELRELAHGIKRHTIAHLDRYLEELERKAIASGANVHWARDGRDVTETITAIARRRGARLIVKSKSMTTEEIDMNRALARAGLDVLETDLGEFIVQLAGERPSHIIAPAVHKTREEVSRLFEEKLAAPHYDEIEALATVARQTLRDKFRQAGIGISGGNFVVAETGTVVIVENEGNARLTTTLPPVHIVVVGIEKVVPRWGDLAVLLKLLPRAATGQKMTTYVSFLSGRRRPAEQDGPEELHLILLDNGRTRLLASAGLRESLYCIRCGACLNVCPVYRKVGGHSYGSAYSGPIGAVVTPNLQGLAEAKDLPYASSLCGACADACPVKIPLPEMLLRLRGEAVAEAERGVVRLALGERWAFRLWGRAMRSERAYKFSASLMRFVLRWAGGAVWLPWLLRPLAGWSRFRELPRVPEKSFRARWDEKALE